jgi:copper chaperone
MEKITLNVPGMSCSHCEHSIKGALTALDGVDTVSIDLQDKTVKVSYASDKVTEDAIKEAIEGQGYDVS